jgi:hypothetical protein
MATLQTYCQPATRKNIPEHYQKILKFLASKNLQNIQQETRFHPAAHEKSRSRKQVTLETSLDGVSDFFL